jgi:hypothetical protein
MNCLEQLGIAVPQSRKALIECVWVLVAVDNVLIMYKLDIRVFDSFRSIFFPFEKLRPITEWCNQPTLGTSPIPVVNDIVK